jgi:hypothetical protein
MSLGVSTIRARLIIFQYTYNHVTQMGKRILQSFYQIYLNGAGGGGILVILQLVFF